MKTTIVKFSGDGDPASFVAGLRFANDGALNVSEVRDDYVVVEDLDYAEDLEEEVEYGLFLPEVLLDETPTRMADNLEKVGAGLFQQAVTILLESRASYTLINGECAEGQKEVSIAKIGDTQVTATIIWKGGRVESLIDRDFFHL